MDMQHSAAATVNGKHRHEPTTAAERYGKHSQAHATLPVATVLQRVTERGEAIRLAWRDDSNRVFDNEQEFPTAVLPVVRPSDDKTSVIDETPEPSPSPDHLRQRELQTVFSWWPKKLAS